MKWLKIEDGSLVNLDHIASVEIIPVFKTTQSRIDRGKFVVVLFAANDHDTVYEACKGSQGKCEDFMDALQEFVEGKMILAVDHAMRRERLNSLIQSYMSVIPNCMAVMPIKKDAA